MYSVFTVEISSYRMPVGNRRWYKEFNFGIAFDLGLSVVGAAWGIWLTGSSLVSAAVKAHCILSKSLIRSVPIPPHLG